MRKVLLILPACMAALLASGIADTLTLKSGETLEGKITSETAESVTIEYKLAGGITDERTVPRAEIAKLEKPEADAVLYERLKGVKPDPSTSFAVETYDGMMFPLKEFLEKYPSNPHKAEIQGNLDDLKKEQERVTGGDVKFLGDWLKPEEAAARTVQIEGQKFYGSIKELTARGDYVGALNAFDQMEKKYATTTSYPRAIELARQLAAAVKADAEKRRRDLQGSEANFVKQLALTPEPSKSQILSARKAEQARAEAAMAAAEKSGLKWKPLIGTSTKSLELAAQTGTAEVTRLAVMPVAAMNASIDLAMQARAAISKKEFDTAETLLSKSKTAWSSNEEATYLTTQLKAAQAAAAASSSPGSSPGASGSQGAAASTPKSTPRSTPVAGAKAAAGDESEKPFYKTIPGAIAIVVGVLGALAAGNFFVRMKARRSETE